jgi:transposase InsO family protein
VKKIRSDNGSEFKNLQVEEYLEEEGIKNEFSAPNTPQQNGVVERKNRTLIDMARTMLGEYKTPERFWSEAMNTACHAINRLYLHHLLKKTSYELLTGNKPSISYFRVFGRKCYILVKKGRHSKLDPKAVEGFLLGYVSHPILEGKPNANHVRARIRNSRTQRLHNWTSSHNARIK